MKKHIRIAAAALSGALLIMTSPPCVFAADENEVDFDGAALNYIGVKSYGNTPNDLFGEKTKGLAPGAEETVTVLLGNNSAETVTFSLKAEALKGEDAKAVASSSAENKTANDALLSKITVTVTHRGETIYKGTLGGDAGAELYSDAGAALGTLAPYGQGEIKATLSVPKELDYNYFDSLCAVDWTFRASYDDGGGGYGGGTIPEGRAPLDDGPLTEISEEGTPLGDLPDDTDMVLIADPETPLALPQTGGLVTYATPAAAALAVLLALYAAACFKGRKKRGETA